MAECYGKGVKYSLFVANSIIFISGAILLAIGVWTISDRSIAERLLGINLYVASTVLLIITGTVVAFIAVLGGMGAYKEVRCMLKTYFAILLILMTIITSIGALCFVYQNELDERVQIELQRSMKFYANDSRVTEAWDSMQRHFECCGVATQDRRSYESWRRESSKFNSPNGPFVPVSCCRSQEDDQIKRACQGQQPRKEDTYSDGCYEKMKQVFKSHTVVIGAVSIFGVFIIAVGLLLSGVLYCIISRKPAERSSESSGE